MPVLRRNRASRVRPRFPTRLPLRNTHEWPRPLLPTLWAAYGVNADTLVRCWSQRYGVANRLRALGEDDLADRPAHEE